MGIYRRPFCFMYAFVSRTAAFRYGAADVSFGVVTAYGQLPHGGFVLHW